MTFRNVRFPTGIRFGSGGGPMWLTDRVRINSGRVLGNKIQSYPLRRFQMASGLKDDTTKRSLLAFCLTVGPLDRFRFKDWGDYDVASGEGVFTALGADQYQLVKRYTFGSLTYDEDIVLPVDGSITITGLTEGVNWSTGYTTPSGVVTLLGSPTPSAPSAWTGEFDRHVMFVNDKFELIWGEGDTFEAVSVEIEEQPV